MPQSTREKVVMGLVNGHCSQTAQIKNDDGRLKPIVSSADGGGARFDFIPINSLAQTATFDQWHSVVGGSRRDEWRRWAVGGGGEILISEITDLVLNVNPEPLVEPSGRRRRLQRSARLKEKHRGRPNPGQEVGNGNLALCVH